MEVILPFCVFFFLGIFKRGLLLLLASIRSVQTDVNRILLLASCSQITKMAVLFYFGPGSDLTNSSHYLDKFYSLSAQVILSRTYHAEHVCSSLVAVPNTEFPGNA